MTYCKRTAPNTAVEYTLRQLREDNPNVSFPRSFPDIVLANYDVFPAVETPQPAYDPTTQNITRGGFTRRAGVWERVWTVEAKSQQEQTDYRDWRTLTPEQFEYMAETTGLRTVIQTYIADLKTKGQHDKAARIRSGLIRSEYRLGWFLDVFANHRAAIQVLFPGADLSDTRIINEWYAAEQVSL